MEAKLVVVGGKANKAEVKLKLPTVIGRGRDADLTVAHGTVSRHHCLIYELDGALVVRDNGSLNGTLICGERINEALLKPGNTLTVGPLTFRADYEHDGNFPRLSEQPTLPNFQDTIGDQSKGNGAVAAPSAEAALTSDSAASPFEFLSKESAGAPAAGEVEEEVEQFALPNFDEPADAEDHAEETPSAETPVAHALDFLAGGSDAPADDDASPGFDFLASNASPAADVAEEELPAEELAVEEEAPEQEIVAAAPDEDDLPQFDPDAEISASGDREEVQAHSAVDDAPNFGFLSGMAPAAEADEPEASLPEITLHDPEESDAERAALSDAPEMSDEASIKFEDDTAAPPADSSGGFDFLLNASGESASAAEEAATHAEGELQAFAPPLEARSLNKPEAEAAEQEASALPVSPDLSVSPELPISLDLPAEEPPLAAANDASDEFSLPLEAEAADDDDGVSFNFFDADATKADADETSEHHAVAEDDSESYAISLEPPVAIPPRSVPLAETDAMPEEKAPAPELELSAAAAEASAAETEADADSEAGPAKKKGWWPFGKSKQGEAPKTTAKGKAVDKPIVAPQAGAPTPAPQLNFSPPAADADDAAMAFLSDSPAPTGPATAAGKDSSIKIETGEPAKKKAASGGDDELDNFFESIGLD